jgi:hypothetical protein
MRRFTRTSLLIFVALALCGHGQARAEVAEDLVVPSFRKVSASDGQANLIQFRVPERGVASISVLARARAKDGRVDQQIFELRPSDSKGAFPNSRGFQMWESDKIYASIHQWASNRGNLDRVEFSYVVHKVGRDQQRAPVESRHVYTFARGHELDGRNVADGNLARAGNNRGRGLDRLDAREVQAAVSRLAKKAPAARYYALPGGYPHPLHPQNQILKAIKSVTKAKRAHPERDYFVRFTVYNHDSTELSKALVEAHRAGVRVEHLTDWSQTTPKLSGKPAQEMLRSAGIPVYSMVRNSPQGGDYRTNHSKVWLMGFRNGRGQIAQGTVFDCSFNTEFHNWPHNQEGMLVYRNNRDVATVYNAVVFQSMKGNAPLRLVIDPRRARFAVHHPLYPYVTPQGKPFHAYDALTGFIGKARSNLTMLDYLIEDPGVVSSLGGAARKTRGKATALINGFWGRNAAEMRQQGVNVGRVFLPEGGSPVHHKLGQADGKWVRGGSANPARWSWQSDETMYVIRSKKVAKQVQAQANRLAHTARYSVAMEGNKPAYQTQKVQVEVRLPKGLRLEQGDKVYFAAGGSGEMDSSWLKLERAQSKRSKNKLVFRGSRRLPLGVIHHGKPVIVKRDGRQIFSNRGDTVFNVQPVKSGRQRVRVGFKR